MRLFLVRHGQSTGNLQAVYNGQTDVPLTELGREQAKAIRPILEKFSFDRVFSSDLNRAIETQRLALPNVEGVRTPLLRELDVGNIAGRDIAQVKEENPGWVAIKDPTAYSSFGGESIQDVWDRIGQFFEMLEKDPCDNAIAFAHNGLIAVVISYLLRRQDIDRSALRSANCAIHVLEYDGKCWRLLAWNYMGEL